MHDPDCDLIFEGLDELVSQVNEFRALIRRNVGVLPPEARRSVRVFLQESCEALAIGLPARAMTISSPASARSRRRDRFVLAAWTLTISMAMDQV